MARRSQRLSSTVAEIPATTHKRAASSSAMTPAESKRSKKEKSTPTKSQYFKNSKDDELDEHEYEHESATSVDETASEFSAGNGLAADQSESAESELEEDDSSEDDATPKSKKKKSTPGKGLTSSATIRTKNTPIWRPGVKTGLGPGNQVIIKKPKARPAGKTPYTDETVHPNTFLFLKDLKANNKREWLKQNDAEFRQAEKDWHSFVETMTEKLTEIDDTIPELPVKDVIFRIYRDVRFSKDPTPYKPHFSVAWSRAGRKGSYAHYYIQCAPNNSFVGGGLWHPEAAVTAAMRHNIDRHPRQIKDVLLGESIRKEFFDGAPRKDIAIVKAFAKTNAENALKKKPNGYEADHPDIELLRLRNFTMGRKLTDDEVLGEKGMRRIASLLASLKPYITYLNSVVMPDEEASEASESEGNEEDDDVEQD